MITIKGISKHYAGINAICDVSFAVPNGSIFGIIGKSGAGKSTLLRIMSLLERPDTGSVFYDEQQVDCLKEKELLLHRRTMGMIFQNFCLLSSRNVASNIAFPLEISGISKHKIDNRVNELLNMVGIMDKRKARLRELSGGQKQRVAIARALATNPKILFCDEPTSALDPHTTRSILALIRELHEQLKITIILITHQMEVIRAICDEVVVLDYGRIVEEGDVQTIFNNPKTAITKEFVYEQR